MISYEQNQYLCQTDAGTPMGDLFRRFWAPFLLSNELPAPDCDPVRVRLMGEDLIAFRDTEGRIGLMDQFCAHRGVSLWFGRNEEGGIRCPYHGWKYDVTGRCVDMPTETPDTDFKSRIHLSAYPTIELGDVVWTYLGTGEPPPPPHFEWTSLRPDQRIVTRTWQECNWLQALEGGIDSMHASVLWMTVGIG